MVIGKAAKVDRRAPKIGDVHAVPLGDGRYGAVRIFDHADGAWLLATTEFIGATPPSLAEPSLRRILRQRRFKFNGEPALCWYDGRRIPSNHVFVGVLPVHPEERALERAPSFAGNWREDVAFAALLEWRWEHDRESLVRETEIKQAQSTARLAAERARSVKAPPSVKQGAFWRVVALLDWGREAEDDIVGPAVSGLASAGTAAIKDFYRCMSYFLYQLDGERYARELGEYAYRGEDDHFSVDYFLYARCYVVAQGQATYERVLSDPTTWPRDRDFEALLGVAPAAHQKRTRREWDFDSDISFETFTNGAGWKRPGAAG